jgi:hypothetical protein
MAVNGTVGLTSFKNVSKEDQVKIIDVNTLKTAILNLDRLKGNVNNCNCSPSNCCQSSTNQKCQTCQSNQACQGVTCQTLTNQSCQACQNSQGCNQACESCQHGCGGGSGCNGN